MRVIQLSDVHFGAVDRPALEAATAYVADARADLLMITGDLTLNGLPEEFRAAQAWLERLPGPMLVTPGNHDTPYWNIPLRAFQPFQRYRRYIGTPQASRIDLPGLHARMINTSRGFQPRLDWSKGAVNLGLAQAAVTAVCDHPPADMRIIGCHHPLVEVAGSPVTGDVHRGQAAARLLCEAGVDVILTGHVHNPFAVALPFGDEKTYAVGAGTLSTRTRGVPPGFNILDINAAAVEVTAMAWMEDQLQPWRVWTLPRRSAPAGTAPAAILSRAEVVVQVEGPGETAGP
jgi:3',5'-cyclic AMP phosphodiesterase CpdA